MNTKKPENESDRVWAAMCQTEGLVCKLCGAVPPFQIAAIGVFVVVAAWLLLTISRR